MKIVFSVLLSRQIERRQSIKEVYTHIHAYIWKAVLAEKHYLSLMINELSLMTIHLSLMINELSLMTNTSYLSLMTINLSVMINELSLMINTSISHL